MLQIRSLTLALLTSAAAAAAAYGQEVAVGARGGTFGLGGEAVLGLGRVAVRAGVGAVPFTPSGTISGVRYEIEPPSPLVSAGADLYLLHNLRLVGGVLFGVERTDFTGRLAEPARIGDQTYTPEQAGTLLGVFRTRSAAPFVGLGFGRYGDTRVGVTLDLGVAFLGENDLELSATGPFAGDPTFQQELEKERVSVEEDLREYTRLLPMLNIGLHITVSR